MSDAERAKSSLSLGMKSEIKSGRAPPPPPLRQMVVAFLGGASGGGFLEWSATATERLVENHQKKKCKSAFLFRDFEFFLVTMLQLSLKTVTLDGFN